MHGAFSTDDGLPPTRGGRRNGVLLVFRYVLEGGRRLVFFSAGLVGAERLHSPQQTHVR